MMSAGFEHVEMQPAVFASYIKAQSVPASPVGTAASNRVTSRRRDGQGHGLIDDILPDEDKTRNWSSDVSYFIVFMLGWEMFMIVLFIMFAKYAGGSMPGANTDNLVTTSYYNMLTDLSVMTFLGFGYLMSYLRRYGYGAIGLSMFLACMCAQWYLLCRQFWRGVMTGDWEFAEISIRTVASADYCSVALLVSFGALIGKVSPLQLAIMGFLETIIYSLNESIGIYKFVISDVGNSITLHLFGAYFGLAASLWVLPALKRRPGPKETRPSYRNDMFAYMGSYWLWMLWPSFNALNAATPEGQARAVVNTFFAITASGITSFGVSALFRKKFDSVDIQTAALAGGIAIGGSAQFIINPGACIAVGSLAGLVAIVGELYIQGLLQRKFGVHDVCGVNNLFGMPGLIGAGLNFIIIAIASEEMYKSETLILLPALAYRTAKVQSYYQFVYTGCTLALALVFGSLAGIILSRPKIIEEDPFVDTKHWHTPETETPYYFDTRKIPLEDFERRLKRIEDEAIDLLRKQQAAVLPLQV